MKFGIISIDDSRIKYKNKIRSEFAGLEEIKFECVDARSDGFDIDEQVGLRGLRMTNMWAPSRLGEIGGWLSHYNSWVAVSEQDEPVVIFEDDADIPDGFINLVERSLLEVPSDYDFLALCVPEDQKPDYMWVNKYTELGEPRIVGRYFDEKMSRHYIGSGRWARAYPGYGHTAMLFSPAGAKKLVELAKRVGLYTPADCFILNMSHAGMVNGYAPKPKYADEFVKFNTDEKSIIQSNR